MRIKSIKARQVLNSKGHPTLQIEASTARNHAIATVPLASSKSKYEFADSYDKTERRFHVESLNYIVETVDKIIFPALEGQNSGSQEDIDRLLLQLDNTLDRSRLGVSTISATSQAIARLGAIESDLPLFKYLRVLYDFTGLPHSRLNSNYMMPKPVITYHSSSSHDTSSNLPIQEILLLPQGNFKYQYDLIPFFENLSNLNLEKKAANSEQYFDLLVKEIKRSGAKFSLGLDFAASKYKRNEGGNTEYVIPNFTSENIPWKGDFHKLVRHFLKWAHKYNLSFFEDLFSEDDYSAWKEFKDKLFEIDPSAQIVSDDFTATNSERLDKVSMLECCNNVVIKPSQIGTVIESIHFAQRARKYGHSLTVSYRHGETEDSFISDFAVGINADFIRTGYYKGSEYISKLNRLISIEEETN
jgi:enolase